MEIRIKYEEILNHFSYPLFFRLLQIFIVLPFYAMCKMIKKEKRSERLFYAFVFLLKKQINIFQKQPRRRAVFLLG